MKDKLRYLKGLLEARLEADENRIKHSENYSDKIVSMLGELAKRLVEYETRLEKLENVHKNRRKKINKQTK